MPILSHSRSNLDWTLKLYKHIMWCVEQCNKGCFKGILCIHSFFIGEIWSYTVDIKVINSAKRQFTTVWFLLEGDWKLISLSWYLNHTKTWKMSFHLHTYFKTFKIATVPQFSACTTSFIGWGSQLFYKSNCFLQHNSWMLWTCWFESRKWVSSSVKCRPFSPQTLLQIWCEMFSEKVHWGGDDHLLRTTQLTLQTLEASRQRALHGVLWVRQEVAVEGPAEGEEIQGLAALLLSGGADWAAGLEDATLRAALGQKHPTHQSPQGFEARQLHQHLDGQMEKSVWGWMSGLKQLDNKKI